MLDKVVNDSTIKYLPDGASGYSPIVHTNSSTNEACPQLAPEYTANFEMAICLPGNAIYSQLQKWTDDPGFYPTSITYGLAFVIGVAGNALVVFALLGDKKARNATSSFLVSLAIADLLFLLTCVPYETAAKLSTYWKGGQVLCKISGYVEMMTAAASIINLTAVSVER